MKDPTEKTDETFSDTGLVIVAGGGGSRFGGRKNKLLVTFEGAPVILHSLRRFAPLLPCQQTIVVVSKDLRKELIPLIEHEDFFRWIKLVEGGSERQDSVFAGLKALPSTCVIAAIHDAARPRMGIDLLTACVQSARLRGSGVAAIPVRDTTKLVDQSGDVIKTLDRDALRATETPQVFDRALITTAYQEIISRGITVTDDAQAVELTGGKVHLVLHAGDNRKITFQSDL
ncbi:MAG: 2-C-methyl-D-erythritol 4-phosphate cytidylyltransferase [Lentisphaeria bacterium]|nr:2-C-methyl-D-erythritol 4-phosphate cytidylyltransferase [Lentisphaeria bacterium]